MVLGKNDVVLSSIRIGKRYMCTRWEKGFWESFFSLLSTISWTYKYKILGQNIIIQNNSNFVNVTLFHILYGQNYYFDHFMYLYTSFKRKYYFYTLFLLK